MKNIKEMTIEEALEKYDSLKNKNNKTAEELSFCMEMQGIFYKIGNKGYEK